MEMGVFTVPFAQRPFGEALDVIKATGCEVVEIGTGGAPGNAHCDLDNLGDNDQDQEEWRDKITSRELEISALSYHGNSLHPRQDVAKAEDDTLRQPALPISLASRTSSTSVAAQ